MKTIAKLGFALGALAAMGYAADSWNGKLIDAACYSKNQKSPADSKETCGASASTTSFAIQTADGKVYSLDATGNSKAATALRGNPDNKSPEATVSGSMEGQTVKVESISVH